MIEPDAPTSYDANAEIPAMEVMAGFDTLYRAINTSEVYREALHARKSGLPNWVRPLSIIDRALLIRMATQLRIGEGDLFVDLACGGGGPGIWIAERTGASLVGIDFAPSAIEAARSLAERRSMSARVRFDVADATATGLPSASVDAIMSIDALMFIDAQKAATEIARILKPDGVLIVTAAEALIEPFTPTIVRDYRPIFERLGFRTILHEELTGRHERQLALYRALCERAERLRNEIGETAEILLEEARNGLTRARQGPVRVRDVLFVVQRIGNRV